MGRRCGRLSRRFLRSGGLLGQTWYVCVHQRPCGATEREHASLVPGGAGRTWFATTRGRTKLRWASGVRGGLPWHNAGYDPCSLRCSRLKTNLLGVSEPNLLGVSERRELVVGPVVRWPNVDGRGRAPKGGAAPTGSLSAYLGGARVG